MANEISITASLSCFKPSVMAQAIGRSVVGDMFTMTGNFYVQNTLLAGTTPTLVPLGQVTAPHWSFWENNDPTNYFTLRNGVSGADVAQFFPGESGFVPLFTTGTYYVLANTAPVLLEYLIISL